MYHVTIAFFLSNNLIKSKGWAKDLCKFFETREIGAVNVGLEYL